MKKSVEKRLKELEDKIKELESRPVVQPVYLATHIYPILPPSYLTPNLTGTIMC